MRRLVTLTLVASFSLGSTAVAADTDVSPSPPTHPVISGGRTELAGARFAVSLPDEWEVEYTNPDPDIFTVSPGTAWEALTASAPDGHMACSFVVGVSEASFFEPPDRAGSALGQGGVDSPMWDRDEPHLLWVPEPVVPDAQSYMQITWDRLQDEEQRLPGDAAYSLLCVTSDPLDAEPGGSFTQIMGSFEFLP